MIDENLSKNLHLINELNASVKLLELGLGEIQNLSLENDFYFLPLQLLSSGLERLMKSYICLGFYEINNDYPDSSYLKKCGGKSGHDLIELKKAIAENYFKTNGIFILEEDLNIISNDKKLDELIYLLSEFGKYSRYYNLDVVTSASKPSIDVVTLWEEFENNILHSKPELFETLSNIETSQKAFDYINRAIIIHLERFIRALCRQFTLGALGKKALEFSIIVSSFSKLVDEKIGDRNYRGNTNNYIGKKKKPHSRTCFDKIIRKFNKNFIHKVIEKKYYEGDWPFYSEKVIIECREKYWYVVSIDNKDYALNGCAQGRYKLEDVHEAGMAILGKSVAEFIDIAKKLGDKK